MNHTSSPTQRYLPNGRRAWVFLAVAGILGLAELATLSGRFHTAEPTRLAVYLALVSVASCFRLTHAGSPVSFSLNIPFLLVCLLDFTIPEATLAGAIGGLIQSLRSPVAGGPALPRPLLVILSTGIQTMTMATASFVFHSMLPGMVASVPLQLAMASMLLFGANTLPVAISRRLGDDAPEERVGALWRAKYFWALPYYLVAGALAQLIRLGPSMLTSDQSLLAMVALYLAFRQYRAQRNDWATREKHSEEMTALHLRAIEGLALAVEAKDVMNTRGHLRRVQVYALGIGRAMGLSNEEMEALHAGSLLHDIGKLAVPEHILTKPGKLTAEEFAKMKVHPLVGAEIVDQMQFPYPVAPIVRAHHEKFDGSGYPYGLKGEQIPVGARILTVVDFLDAMTSDREYRKGVPVAEALRMIRVQAGKDFDPAVVTALEQNIDRLEGIARQQAAEGPVLSIDATVERGAAPGAGLDLVGLAIATGSVQHTGADAPSEAFRQLAAELGGVVDGPGIYSRTERILLSRMRFEAFAIFLLRGNELVADYARGRNAVSLAELEVPAGQGVTGWVAQNMQPVVNGNPSVDPGLVLDEPLDSVLAVPLVSGNRLEGVLSLYREGKDAFTREEARMVSALGPALASALQNAHSHQQIEVTAHTDPVTGVPTEEFFKRALTDELKRAERRRKNLCLVLVDLGNEPPAGYLAAFSAELSRTSREYDRIGRMGDGRFGVLLPGLGPENVAGVLLRLRQAVESAASQAGTSLDTVSIGGAFYPADGEGTRHILSVAENRLKQGAGNWETSLAALVAVGEQSPGYTVQAGSGEFDPRH